MVDNQTETSTKNSRKISGKQIGYIQCFVTREGDPRWLSLGKVPRDLCITTTVVHLVNVNIKMVLNLNTLVLPRFQPKSPSEWPLRNVGV